MLFVELSSRKELLREDFRRFNKDFPRFDRLLPENNSLPPHQGLLLIPEKWQKKHFQWTPLSGIFPNTCCSGQTKSPFSSRSCQHSLVRFHIFSPQICKWALSSRQGSELVLPGLQLNRGQRTTPTLASGLFFSFWFWHANIFKGRQRQMWPLRISTTTPRLIQWWTPTGWRRRM